MGIISAASEKIKKHVCFCGVVCGVICGIAIIIAALLPPKGSNQTCEINARTLDVLQAAKLLLSKSNEINSNSGQASKIVATSERNFQSVTPANSQRVTRDNSQNVTPGDSQTTTPGDSQSVSPVNSQSVTDSESHHRLLDCSDVLKEGHSQSGVYTIWPKRLHGKSIQVYCKMSDGEAWTVIQRRGRYPAQQNFDLEWADYKIGFGDLTKEFWLGNENIHALTHQGRCEVRFDLEDVQGEQRYAIYTNFRIEDESSDYTLHVSNYTGNAGDGMQHHNKKKFATKDKDHNEGARFLRGGWWIFEWAYVHINGLYLPGEVNPRSIHWYDWHENQGLAGVEMKIRCQ
ncbi:techylectin-5A [Caerostris darwini]|uniref:Techylectin-5A n=1 Tax=Caerostris darwini TaxID=1538125 RepID=A0AAV4VEA1_9ARAC|nr:techylectin-5A [Caerostris darwini]